MIKQSIDPEYKLYLFKKDRKCFLSVGMAKRKFRDKIKEHKADLRLNRPHTALSIISLDSTYNRLNRPHTALSRLAQTRPIKVDFNKSKIIFRTNNYQVAIIRESTEIIANKVISYNAYDIHGEWKDIMHNRSNLVLLKFEYLYLASHLTYNL